MTPRRLSAQREPQRTRVRLEAGQASTLSLSPERTLTPNSKPGHNPDTLPPRHLPLAQAALPRRTALEAPPSTLPNPRRSRGSSSSPQALSLQGRRGSSPRRHPEGTLPGSALTPDGRHLAGSARARTRRTRTGRHCAAMPREVRPPKAGAHGIELRPQGRHKRTGSDSAMEGMPDRPRASEKVKRLALRAAASGQPMNGRVLRPL